MLIRFFKNNNPSSFIILPLFAVVLWINGFFSFLFIPTFLALLLIVSEAFLLNYVVNKYEILTKPSFLPALFYIVFMSNDSAMLTLHPLLFASIFIILAIYKLVSSYQKDTAFSNAFDAGVLFSVSTLFYFPGIVFLPLLGIGFILFRPFIWREWVISLFGVLVPYLFVFTYYFWNDMTDYRLDVNIFVQGFREQPKWDSSKSFYFMAGVSALIILFSFRKLFTGFPEASQKNKKGVLLLLWFFAFAMLSISITPTTSIQRFSALAIPASVFCAGYFLKIKKEWWAELLFMLLLASVFINQFSGYF